MTYLDEKFYVVHGMRAYGGSFVKALAEAVERADVTNYVKLKYTFPEYWKKYYKLGKKRYTNG